MATETIVRGTTPTHTFFVDLDLTTAEVVYVSYKQRGGSKVLIEHAVDQMDVYPDKLVFTLTQEETLKLNKMKDLPVEMQIRARFFDGTAVASNWMYADAGMIVKDGVI